MYNFVLSIGTFFSTKQKVYSPTYPQIVLLLYKVFEQKCYLKELDYLS
jgi:hypothetical protein